MSSNGTMKIFPFDQIAKRKEATDEHGADERDDYSDWRLKGVVKANVGSEKST